MVRKNRHIEFDVRQALFLTGASTTCNGWKDRSCFGRSIEETPFARDDYAESDSKFEAADGGAYLLEELQQNLAKRTNETLNRGSVGDLGYVASRLEDAVSFMKNCEPRNLPPALRGEEDHNDT